MLERWKRAWSSFKKLPPGKRFETHYRQQRQKPEARSPWHRALWLGGALVAFAIGVVLVFIPGPAFVFFGLSAALLASQSRRVAHALDWLELRLRALYQRAQNFWQDRRRST